MILLAIMVAMSERFLTYLNCFRTDTSPDPTFHLVLPGPATLLEV